MHVRTGRARWLFLLVCLGVAIPLVLVSRLASGVSRPASGALPATGSAHGELETNISGNGSNINTGEPEIAINPLNQNELWVDGATFPTPLLANSSQTPVPNTCQGWSSEDGGLSWQLAPLPPDVQYAKGAPAICGEDGVAAFGPDGTLYAGGDTATRTDITAPPCPPGTVNEGTACLRVQGFDPVLTSKDGGHTWSAPVLTMGSASNGPFNFAPGSGNPMDTFDRPWLAVDQSTNTVFSLAHNIADREGFVTASTNEARSFGPIYAIDSPAYPSVINSSTGLDRSTMAAAHGVLAVAYVATAAPGKPCPCLIFETSTDKGATFTRHIVPTINAAKQPSPFVAADPTVKGRYALTILDATGTANQVYTTDDSGQTWQGPTTVAEAPSDPATCPTGGCQQFKPWLSYSPSGQLLLVWRTWHGSPNTSPYDVWLAVGRADDHHGAVFGAPVRVSSEAAAYPPRGVGAGQYAGGDDFSFVTANSKYIYVGWGDSRNVSVDVGTPPSVETYKEGGGVQIWLGRLPLNSFGGGDG